MTLCSLKEINDNYGHRVGDRCIAAVAKALNKALFRPTDMAARYGGDEFIVILPDTDMDGVQTIAKKMQKNISELNMENAYSPFGKLTVSIGAAEQIPEQESQWENLEVAVDKALYKAKQNGKNQVAFLQ